MNNHFSTANLAVQLFTLRDFLKTKADFARSLARIKEIGYPAVQLSAVGAMSGDNPEVDAKLARQMLDDNGLKCIATHRSWESLLENTASEIEFHQTLGCDFVAIGGIPAVNRKAGAEGYTAWVREALPLVEKLKAAGLRFGYHNHAFEFERVQRGPDGGPRTFFDIIVENAPDVFLEIDLYWIDHAGKNPERIIERLGGRIPIVHIKDKEMIADQPTIAPIGEGSLDWDYLLPALARAGTEYIAIEQDFCGRDPFDCLISSFEFLSHHTAVRNS